MEKTKSLLAAWIAATPGVLSRELSGQIELRGASCLPQPETALAIAISFGGPCDGRFLVAVEGEALHGLFTAARLVSVDAAAEADHELWSGLLQQIAAVAVQSLGTDKAASAVFSIEEGKWALGLPSAAYEIRLGQHSVKVAFSDEVRIAEAAAAKAASGPDISAEHKTSAKATPGGIDLLLGVELETSLRFGSREMPLSEVLDLGAGDVVELDRHVSDPVDLLVGDKVVARGEVVLVNGSFGLRVLEVAEPKKCLESIRCLF